MHRTDNKLDESRVGGQKTKFCFQIKLIFSSSFQSNKLLSLNHKAGSNIVKAHNAFKEVQDTVKKMNEMMTSVEMEVEQRAQRLNIER